MRFQTNNDCIKVLDLLPNVEGWEGVQISILNFFLDYRYDMYQCAFDNYESVNGYYGDRHETHFICDITLSIDYVECFIIRDVIQIILI